MRSSNRMMTMQTLATTHELDQTLADAARGDAQAWEQLVRAYTFRVYGLLFRQCRDQELSEEITQATFVKVVTKLKDYDERGRFEPWLFRIAMNLLRDEMRRRKRHATPMDMSPGAVAGASGASDAPSQWAAAQDKVVRQHGQPDRSPLEEMTHVEQLDAVTQAVQQLSETDREIVYLRHTAGLTFAQIADTLEQPLGTVLARGHRALAKLRKLLEGEE